VAKDGKSGYCKTQKKRWQQELLTPAAAKKLKLELGPIMHKEVPRLLLDVMRWTYSIVGRHMYPTLEQWELGFMHDVHIDQEVALWHRLAFAFIDYHQRRALPVRPGEEEKKLIGLLVAVSSGPLTPEQLQVTPEEHSILQQCWLSPDGWEAEAARVSRLVAEGGSIESSWSPPEHLKDWGKEKK
jgi:hypothetical protein